MHGDEDALLAKGVIIREKHDIAAVQNTFFSDEELAAIDKISLYQA